MKWTTKSFLFRHEKCSFYLYFHWPVIAKSVGTIQVGISGLFNETKLFLLHSWYQTGFSVFSVFQYFRISVPTLSKTVFDVGHDMRVWCLFSAGHDMRRVQFGVSHDMRFVSFSVPAKIIENLSSSDTTVREGETVTLVCNVTGIPLPRVTWYRHVSDKKGQERESEFCPGSNCKTFFLFLHEVRSCYQFKTLIIANYFFVVFRFNRCKKM